MVLDPLPASSIGVYSRTMHECTGQNYPLFLVPNVWVLPKTITLISVAGCLIELYIIDSKVHSK